jgi:hypothetical protein
MAKRQMVDSIYLNKGSKPMDTGQWNYYRISSFGEMGDPIEICLLKFPEFDTGYESAYPNLLAVLKSKWNIEHSDEDLIGFRVREV